MSSLEFLKKFFGGEQEPPVTRYYYPGLKPLKDEPFQEQRDWHKKEVDKKAMHELLASQWQGRGAWSNDYGDAMKPLHIPDGQFATVGGIYNPNRTPSRALGTTIPPKKFVAVDHYRKDYGDRSDLSSTYRHERIHKDLNELPGLEVNNPLLEEKRVKALDYIYADNRKQKKYVRDTYNVLWKNSFDKDLEKALSKDGSLTELEMKRRALATQPPNRIVPEYRDAEVAKRHPMTQQELLSHMLKQWAYRK